MIGFQWPKRLNPLERHMPSPPTSLVLPIRVGCYDLSAPSTGKTPRIQKWLRGLLPDSCSLPMIYEPPFSEAAPRMNWGLYPNTLIPDLWTKEASKALARSIDQEIMSSISGQKSRSLAEWQSIMPSLEVQIALNPNGQPGYSCSAIAPMENFSTTIYRPATPTMTQMIQETSGSSELITMQAPHCAKPSTDTERTSVRHVPTSAR